MTVGIGAQGFVGIAFETTQGAYTAPTKFFPIMDEGLAWTQDTNWRRVIRGTADVIGAVPGNGHVEGDLNMELLSDTLPYFMQAMRATVTKTGAAAPFTYTAVPKHNAVPAKTLSITVVRNGVAFGYTGCVVSQASFGADNDMATVTWSILGTAEEDVAVPGAPAYSGDEPFGSGKWSIQIPTATQVFDTDNFSLEINDNGEAHNRLKNTLGAQFVAFGEREVTISFERDFESKAEYNEFKALTSKSVTVRVENAVDDAVEFLVPVSFVDGYDVGLSGVGDLVRASVDYMGAHDAGVGGGYQMEVVTNEDVTV